VTLAARTVITLRRERIAFAFAKHRSMEWAAERSSLVRTVDTPRDRRGVVAVTAE